MRTETKRLQSIYHNFARWISVNRPAGLNSQSPHIDLRVNKSLPAVRPLIKQQLTWNWSENISHRECRNSIKRSFKSALQSRCHVPTAAGEKVTDYWSLAALEQKVADNKERNLISFNQSTRLSAVRFFFVHRRLICCPSGRWLHFRNNTRTENEEKFEIDSKWELIACQLRSLCEWCSSHFPVQTLSNLTRLVAKQSESLEHISRKVLD